MNFTIFPIQWSIRDSQTMSLKATCLKMVARDNCSLCKLLSCVTLSSEKSQWELFLGGMKLLWSLCELDLRNSVQLMKWWSWSAIGPDWSGISSLIQWFSGIQLTHCVEWTKCTLYRSQYWNAIAVYAQCLFIEDLEHFSDQFVKWWSWSTIGLAAEVCWVIQLHSIINIV